MLIPGPGSQNAYILRQVQGPAGAQCCAAAPHPKHPSSLGQGSLRGSKPEKRMPKRGKLIKPGSMKPPTSLPWTWGDKTLNPHPMKPPRFLKFSSFGLRLVPTVYRHNFGLDSKQRKPPKVAGLSCNLRQGPKKCKMLPNLGPEAPRGLGRALPACLRL